MILSCLNESALLGCSKPTTSEAVSSATGQRRDAIGAVRGILTCLTLFARGWTFPKTQYALPGGQTCLRL
jgi:hypothetical protein